MSFRGTDTNLLPTYQGAIRHKEDIAFSNLYSIPQTIDRIGSGDAFTGGIIYSLLHKKPIGTAINTAVACGALKHSMEGDFCILTAADIEQFINNGPVNRVIR